MVDIDLLPQVYMPRRVLTIPLNLERVFWALAALGVAAGGLQLMNRNTMNDQLTAVQDEIAAAEIRVRVAAVPPEVRALQDRVTATERLAEGLQRDAGTIQGLQRPWGRIVNLLVNLKPEGVQLTAVTQNESDALRLEGTTENEGAAVGYAARLRDSSLFSEVSIQSLVAKQAPITPTPPSVGGIVISPSAVPAAPTPTPTLDYVLLSATRSVREDGGPFHHIRGRVIDRFQRPLAGVSLQISSCCPVWTAQSPQPTGFLAPGEFEFFAIGPGVFTVRMLDALPGRSQAATQLLTEDAAPGVYFQWDLVFQRLTDLPAAALTVTPTYVPTPAGTPVLGLPIPNKTATVAVPTPVATSSPATPTALAVVVQPGAGLQPVGAATSPTAVATKTEISFTILLTLTQQPTQQRSR